MKCNWDGVELVPQPYYTLPAPGRYAVMLKNEVSSIKTEVIVLESPGGSSLKCTREIPSFLKGRLSIVWLHHVVENTYQNL